MAKLLMVFWMLAACDNHNRPYMRAPALSTGFFFFVLS